MELSIKQNYTPLCTSVPLCLRVNYVFPVRQKKHGGTEVHRGRLQFENYCPRIHANISGATIDASLSTMNFGVSIPNFPQVIFSLGTAPE